MRYMELCNCVDPGELLSAQHKATSSCIDEASIETSHFDRLRIWWGMTLHPAVPTSRRCLS